MPGRSPSRGRPIPRGAAAVLLAGLPILTAAHASAEGSAKGSDGIRLAEPIEGVDPLANVDLGLRPDRLRTSVVPGPVHDEEHVRVEVGPTGAPARVTDRQRLVIRGEGSYIVLELGPARDAVGLGDTVPPVLKLGTVVWQGFSPGRRELSALLTLDPGIEAARLPMSVTLLFQDRAGRPSVLLPGAEAPADGTVTVGLANNTASTRTVEVGQAEVAPLARLLDRFRRVAEHPRESAPPVAGAGLPSTVAGRTEGRTTIDVTAPLRVTGTVTAPGGSDAVSGPGLTPTAAGADVEGTLSGTASFTVDVAAGDRIGLDLDVRPWPDPRTVEPPSPYRSWKAWARDDPDPAAVTAATTTLATAAAAAARAAEYSPYLHADAPGSDVSTFTYVVAPPEAVARTPNSMRPRPGAITLAAVALLAIIGNAELLRRQL
jgi:hypothetical protein